MCDKRSCSVFFTVEKKGNTRKNWRIKILSKIALSLHNHIFEEKKTFD